MKNILFIAWQDVRNQMRQGSTLLWVFVMPPIFFYFIGTVTGGLSAGISGGQATPLTVVAESPGMLQDQITLRLQANQFETEWVESLDPTVAGEAPTRTLSFDASRERIGGCWWPIEVTPEWMQFVQKLIPTGWTMDALHKLISFQAGAASVIPNIAILLVATIVFGGLAVRRFRYE